MLLWGDFDLGYIVCQMGFGEFNYRFALEFASALTARRA